MKKAPPGAFFNASHAKYTALDGTRYDLIGVRQLFDAASEHVLSDESMEMDREYYKNADYTVPRNHDFILKMFS